MSKYTTEVRFICESEAGLDASEGYNSVNRIIEKARKKIFDFDYPIFDSDYKSVLETKILKHYYTREIGEETYGLWKMRLDARLNEIMPYYNQLYKSELIKIEPFKEIDITKDHKGNRNEEKNGTENRSGNANTNTETTAENTEITKRDTFDAYSDTPQGQIDNLKNYQYLTNARDVSEVSEVTNKNSVKEDAHTDTSDSTVTNDKLVSTDDYIEHITGKQSTMTYSKMLMEYRDTFLNIDMKIINDLSNLFMLLW